MIEPCSTLAPLRDAYADGRIGDADSERLREHLSGCAACRDDVRERTAVVNALSQLALPAAPPELVERIHSALDREERGMRGRIWRWSTGTAAALAAGLLLMLVMPAGAEMPRVVRESSAFHDRVVSGAVRPESLGDPAALRDYFRASLGAEVYAPALGCNVEGGCVCSLPDEKLKAPWIVYRRGETLISLLVLEDDGRPLPASARRTQQGRDYYVFRCGENTIVCCRSEKLCHVWIARMDEARLLETALSTREGKQAFSGQRLTLRGVT